MKPCKYVTMNQKVDACDYIEGGMYYGNGCPAAASDYIASGSITVPEGTVERFTNNWFAYSVYTIKITVWPRGNTSGRSFCEIPLRVYNPNTRYWTSYGAVVAVLGLATYGFKRRKLVVASSSDSDSEEVMETEFVGSSL